MHSPQQPMMFLPATQSSSPIEYPTHAYSLHTKDIQNALLKIVDDTEDDIDISNELVAEAKIEKIDKKLAKTKGISKCEKRRLQNRRSALKCRMRKANLITTLSQEVGELQLTNSNLLAQVSYF